jgi:hypothetical protein
MISGTAPGVQSYTIGTAPKSVTVPAFLLNSNSCVPGDIVYSMTINTPFGVTDKSWITFDAATRLVSYD